MQPVIGITVDNRDNTQKSGKYECAIAYVRAVTHAGGVPVLLPHLPSEALTYAHYCDGFILTGGVDPDTRSFDEPLHPQARCMDPTRQAFELALLEAARSQPSPPAVLGICLGMQLLALHAGGRLNQYMPDTLGAEATKVHTDNHEHFIELTNAGERFFSNPTKTHRVISSHRQCIDHAGSLQTLAHAPDGTIEAVADLTLRYYLGVQWHPERGGDAAFNSRIFHQFVEAAKERKSPTSPV